MPNVETAQLDTQRLARGVARADLDRSLVNGIAWTSVVTWLSQILSWGSTLIVVHYLDPTDYGLVGMALLYLGLVQMTSELGLGAAVVRFRDLTPDQIRQFNGLSVIAGGLAIVVSLGAAMPLGFFFRESRLPLVVAVMSSIFLTSAFKVVPQALLQKAFRFRTLALIEGTQSLVGASATLTMAIFGFGYWTLVFGSLISATVYSILVVSQSPVGFRRPRLASIRGPFAFSSHMLFTRLAWYGYSNADFAVIGKVLGGSALGWYTLGWTVSGTAVEKITSLVGRVTPAFFATVQDEPAELRRYLLLITEGLALLTFPVCVGIALIAHDIVHLALGDRWTAAIVPLQLLAILATFRSVQPLIPQVLAAIGESQLNMRNAFLTVCVLPIGFIFATRWGIGGVAAAWLILGPLMFSPLLVRTLRRIELPASDYFRSFWPAGSASLIMAGVVMLADRVVLTGAPLYASLVGNILIGGAAYSAALLLFHRKRILVLPQLLRLVRQRRSASGSSNTAADTIRSQVKPAHAA